MRTHVLTATQWAPARLDAAFAFFADAANLEAITPPLLRFQILTPLPIDPLSRPAHALYVRPTIERIFTHRRDVIARVLGPDPLAPLSPAR